jgi:hypothetical protein
VAVGDLSPDQARYVDQLTAGTGIDRSVAVAWVGSESGWGVNKPDHNYLNIGPGRQYGSTDAAASAAASLITSSSLYQGIRSAIAAGPGAQVAAIQSSPWDAAHYGGHRLADVYASVIHSPNSQGNLTGPSGVLQTGFSLGDLAKGALIPGYSVLSHLPGIGGVVGSATDKVVNTVVSAAAGALLQLVFVAAALGLIGLGLARLTGNDARDMFNRANEIKNQAGQAAAIAAMV